MTLREKQSRFVKLVGMLIEYATRRGYEFTFGEASVENPRKVWIKTVGEDGTWNISKQKCEDAVHMERSLHYSRLAIDLNLFVKGKWISDGSHPVWKELGEFWEKLDPLCAWGGRFNDANHFSLKHGGKK